MATAADSGLATAVRGAIRLWRVSTASIASGMPWPRMTGDHCASSDTTSAPAAASTLPIFTKPKVLITEMSFVAPRHRKDKIHKHGHTHLDDWVDARDRFQNELVIAGSFQHPLSRKADPCTTSARPSPTCSAGDCTYGSPPPINSRNLSTCGAAYIHVPFCRHRCGYCNFTLVAGRDDLIDAYLDALECELRRAQPTGLTKSIRSSSAAARPRTCRLINFNTCFQSFRHGFPSPPAVSSSVEANPIDLKRNRYPASCPLPA